MNAENRLEKFRHESWEQFIDNAENKMKFDSWCLQTRSKSAPHQQEFADWISASVERQDLGTAAMIVNFYDQALELAKGLGETAGAFNSGFMFSGLCSAQFNTLYSIYSAGQNASQA